MLNIKEVKQYLLTRQISSVFEKLNELEKNDEIALKFMCIVDFQVEQNNLYSKIRATNFPKLTQQLLDFHSYKYFTFYDYQDSPSLQSKYLKCSKCELFGPYMSMFTHMATNHNAQIGNKLCAYCAKNSLEIHLENGSLQECYENYLQTEEISDIEREATAAHQIVKEFYTILKKISKHMGVHVIRKLHGYAGKGVGRPSKLTTIFDPDVSCTQTINQRNIATCSTKKLDESFKMVIQKMCDGDALTRFFRSPMDGPESTRYSSNRRDQDEQRHSTSNENTSTPPFFERSASSMSHNHSETSTPRLNGPDPFFQYLSTVVNEIPDLQRRRETEQQLMNVAMKARFDQNPPNN